jgi:AmmeMemoRadiSam system protein B
VSDATLLETPLGPLRVDTSVRELLCGEEAAGPSHTIFERMTREADEDEHSIEMHLPYVKVCLCLCLCLCICVCVCVCVYIQSSLCTAHGRTVCEAHLPDFLSSGSLRSPRPSSPATVLAVVPSTA